MKAAVLEELNKMVVKEVETPKVGKEEVLVRVRACAVCGSDIRIFHYGNPRVKPPQIIGHEISGDVIEVGEEVKGFKVGDRVAIGADVPCGECDFCKRGLGNNCPINYAIGYQFPGGYAEYILVNSITLKYGPIHKIPDNLDYESAALAEPLACCLNGLELSQVSPGDTVVVIGAGPAGCLLAELAKNMGATKVILAQRSRARFEFAKKLVNADIFICTSEEDLVERVLQETDGVGADIVITACPSVEAQEEAVSLVKNRGRINLFGGLPKGTRPLCIDSNIIHYKECFIHGSHGSVPRHHKVALDLLAKGIIQAQKFISHRFPLDNILEAFQTVENRGGMKVIVYP